MASGDEEIFIQNDFMSESFDAFEDMRRNEQLVDFKMNFKDCSLVGHRVVLAARIPHFREIFRSFEQEVSLNEVDPDALESVINFAYSGRIKITQENVVHLLSTSNVLQLTQVTDACCEFLGKRLNSNNALEIRKLAEHHGSPKLLETADSHIKKYFQEFTSSESFLTLPFLLLKQIISGDDVKVSTEEKVFEAVITWVKAFPSERKDFLPELLSSVRMYFLTPRYLIERVSTEELVRSSLRCRDVVEEAKSYHLLPDRKSKSCGLLSHPRLYDVNRLSTVSVNAVVSTAQPTVSPLPSDSRHDKVQRLFPSGDPYRRLLCSVYISKNLTTCVQVFDREKKTWLNLPSFRSADCITAVVPVDGVIYIFSLFSVHAFDLHKCKWNSVGYLNQIHDSGSVSYKDRIYFFGGNGIESDKVRSFDPRSREFHQESRMPRCLTHPGVVHVSSSKDTLLGRSIFITGGHFLCNVYNTVERYYPETKKWTKVPSMYYERHSHGCCDLNEKIYVVGGVTRWLKLLTSAEVYDPLTNQWNLLSSKKLPNRVFSVISDEEEETLLFSTHRAIETHDLRNNKWKAHVGTDDLNVLYSHVFLVKSVVTCDTYKRLLG